MSTNMTVYLTSAIVSGVFWLLAYVGMIWRGFKDKLLGTPMLAISGNLAWELTFAFLYPTPSKSIQYGATFWFLIESILAWQCFLYGYKDYKSQFIKKNFSVIFVTLTAIMLLVTVLLTYQFNDSIGVYTGLAANALLSFFLIDLLIRRDDVCGQSLCIAVSKWIGSLAFALATFVGGLPDMNTQLNIHTLPTLFTEIISNKTYPLIQNIFMYPLVFVLDIIYIVLLYRKFMEKKVNIWRF
ncbi:transmembrane-type terpene cyclase [Scytonema sp. PRP1]|uniref:transmembrane-type terpene cyclase n=1 Tax=Scytonema sp. PRP1 TaxID=3120513 RepID=UPI002FD43984